MLGTLNRILLRSVGRRLIHHQVVFKDLFSTYKSKRSIFYQRFPHSFQNRYNILISAVKDSTNDTCESLKVLVNTLENEHQMMDFVTKQDAIRLLLEIEAYDELKKNPEIIENCNLGLGMEFFQLRRK
jgi:hypothetical protein